MPLRCVQLGSQCGDVTNKLFGGNGATDNDDEDGSDNDCVGDYSDDDEGEFPLHSAIRLGDTEAMRRALELGADLEEENEVSPTSDNVLAPIWLTKPKDVVEHASCMARGLLGWASCMAQREAARGGLHTAGMRVRAYTLQCAGQLNTYVWGLTKDRGKRRGPTNRQAVCLSAWARVSAGHGLRRRGYKRGRHLTCSYVYVVYNQVWTLYSPASRLPSARCAGWLDTFVPGCRQGER